jgi:glycine cleavage system H protein
VIAVADDVRYSHEHLWLRRDSQWVTVGITERISRILTWVSAVALPDPGAQLAAGEELVAIDTQKALIAVPSPVAIEVVAVNGDLARDPMLVRLEPRTGGWLLRAALADAAWERLLPPTAYAELTAAP